MTQHVLKTDRDVFAAVQAGKQTHNIRKNDRNFAVGDVLVLRETLHTGEHMALGAPLEYTGREVQRTVSHILTGYGLQADWCILSFAGYMPVAREALDYQLPEPVQYAEPSDSHSDIYDATQVGAAFAAGRAAERAHAEARLRTLLSEPVLDVAAQAVEGSADVWKGFARNDAAGCIRAALDAIKLLPTSHAGALAGVWTIKRQHDLGSVYDGNGHRIGYTYFNEAKAFVDAHNAALFSAGFPVPAWVAVGLVRDAQRYRAVRLRAYAFGVGHPSPDELDTQVDAHLAANGTPRDPSPAKCDFCRVAAGALHKDGCVYIGLNGLPDKTPAVPSPVIISDISSIDQMHIDFEVYLLNGRDGWTPAMFKKTPQGAYLDRDLHWRFKGWMDKSLDGAARRDGDWTRAADQLPERMPDGRQFSREVIVVDMAGSRTCRVSRVHYYPNMAPVWNGGDPTHWCDFPDLPPYRA